LGAATTVTDQAGKKRRSIVDGLGRLIRVDEPDSNGSLGTVASPTQPTSYVYDVLDDLAKVTQGAQTRYFAYDSLKRLIRARNPEQEINTNLLPALTDSVTNNSQWCMKYDYDLNSNVSQKTDARNVTTNYSYDLLNRMASRTYTNDPQSTPAVNYYYDSSQTLPAGKPLNFTVTNSIGRLIAVCYGGASSSAGNYQSYDELGRVTSSYQQTDSNNYGFGYGYNLANEMTSEGYPSLRRITNAYDTAGRLTSVNGQKTGESNKAYASSIGYAPQGAVSSMTLGNNLIDQTSLNNRLQPTQIKLGTTTSPSSVLQLDYTYSNSNPNTHDNNGNVLTQSITIGSTVMSQSYSYDALNRLQTATESGAWLQTYDCDRYGNRAVRVGSFVPTPALTPQSGSSADFSAFNQSTNRIQLSGFGYDAAGNLKNDPTTAANAMLYDAENRQVSYTKAGTTTYSYDGDGHRVKKVVGNVTTIFVYNAMGQLAAEYTNDTTPASGGSATSYMTSDHLGSTRVVTKADGTVKARYDYLPFGEELPSSVGGRSSVVGYNTADSTRQKFTQKERDSESGLDYFGARYYSSAQGRFTSVDPTRASVHPANPQTWNRYVYALNRVLIAIDPDGLATLIVVVSPRASGGTGHSTTYLQNHGGYYVRAGRDNGRFETLSKGNGPNRAVTNNDTPFGVYKIDHTRGDQDARNPNQHTGTEGGTLSPRPRSGDIRYGTGIVHLTPVAGEAVDNDRAQIYFHGGGSSLGSHAFDAQQGLTATHGCIRCQNEDVNTIIGAINYLDQEGDPITHVFVGDADYLRSLAEEVDANGNWAYEDLRIAMGYDQPSKEDRRREKRRAREEARRQDE